MEGNVPRTGARRDADICGVIKGERPICYIEFTYKQLVHSEVRNQDKAIGWVDVGDMSAVRKNSSSMAE